MPLVTTPTSRRRFLATAGAAVSSLTFARAAGARQPQAAARPLRLALLSDTHIPADPAERYRGYSPVENLAKVVPQIVAARVEGAIVGGDLARLEGLPADYVRYKDMMAPLTSSLPVGMVLGNHDHRANFLQAFGAPAAGAPVANKYTTTVDKGGLHFVLLDSLLSPNVTPGQLGSTQRDWLGKQLGAAPSTPTVIVVHHTLGAGDGELVDADRLFEVLRPHKHVKAVIYGHSHKYEVKEREGLQLINLPAVAYPFAESEPIGWIDSVWTSEGVDLTLRSVGGNQAANGQTTSVHWAR